MEKPMYNKDALKKGLIKIDKQIQILREQINKYEEEKVEFMFYIKQWEMYKKLHPEEK